MILKKISSTIAIALSLLSTNVETSAQNVEQIYMKSGSIVEGYISEQKPGKYITFQTTRATIVVNSDSLQNKITEKIPLESLPEKWKNWALQNNKYIEDEGSKQLELSTLEFNNSTFAKVFLLEKGSLIKFLDLTPNQYTFTWGDMYRTTRNKRPENLYSGIIETLVLDDNTQVAGQIIEQFPGKDLKIATDNGEILTFRYNQIKQIKTEKLNQKSSLWTQIQLLDKIHIRGEKSPLQGFISSRTLNQELTIELEDNTERTIPLKQITSYAKVPNPQYAPLYDKILNEGEILLDGAPAYFDILKTQGQYLLLGETVSAQTNIGDTIHIEANLPDPETTITLVRAHIENITQQDGKKKEQIPWPVITYQDLVQSHLPILRETTPSGNTKISFITEQAGDYVLYIQGKDGYIVINVIDSNNR